MTSSAGKQQDHKWEVLRKSRYNHTVLRRFPIENHAKLYFTEKPRNEAVNMTGNSIKPKFVKKTNKQNLPKGFDISRLEIREKKFLDIIKKTTTTTKKASQRF